MQKNNYIAVGKIVGPHGLGGWVKVLSYSKIANRFDGLEKVWIESDLGHQGLWIQDLTESNKGPLIKFKDVNSREDIERFDGCELFVDYEDRMDLPEDTFYVHDLIGIKVFLEKGDGIGEICEVMTGAGNDVYVVITENQKEILIPAVSNFIKEVNLTEKRMIVDLIEGMLPEDEN